MKRPVLIDIELIGHADQVVDPQILPALAELNQADRPLVLLAERPDRWKPTRNRVDQAFKLQADIEAIISRLRQRREALEDLADRYDCTLEQMVAITSNQGRMLETLSECKVSRLELNKKHSLKQRIGQITGHSEAAGH